MDHHHQVVGLDVGHSAVKMTFDVTKGEPPRRHIIPTVVAPGFDIVNSTEASRAEAETVTVDGKHYFVGATALIQAGAETHAGLSEDWITKPQHRALVAAARKCVERASGQPDVRRTWVVGLPCGIYDRDREVLRETVQQIVPKNDRVVVMQQPDAVYLQKFFGRDGLPITASNPSSESWAVVDVGHFTTDFVAYVSGRYWDQASGRVGGLFNVVKRVQDDLKDQGVDLTAIKVEEGIRTGEVVYFGERVPVGRVARPHLEAFASEIAQEAERLIGSRVREFNGVLVAGGGAAAVLPALKQLWPHAQLAEDGAGGVSLDGEVLSGPRFLISEGYYRYGKMLQVNERLGG